jgi:hypothetical protein
MEIDAALVSKVRDGLFLASSRTYAEQYVEPIIREKYNLSEPDAGDHDGVDAFGNKFEIKACKVLKSAGNGKGSKSLLRRILFESSGSILGRLVPFSEHKTSDYLANVQNVKRDHFDTLVYVLLFSDCVKVFFAERETIAKGIFPSWSDKHGRYDQVGKSGQFGITKSTISWHLNSTLKDTLTYEEVTELLSRL